MKVTITVNGEQVREDVEDRTLLVHFLRDVAHLTATNIGCDTTSCGACTVLLDGESVKSCTVLAVQANGRSVTTIEGLVAPDGTWEHHGGKLRFTDSSGSIIARSSAGMGTSARAEAFSIMSTVILGSPWASAHNTPGNKVPASPN